MEKLRLGVNIDHVATIRNARGIMHPDPLRAAELATKAGADGITAHLREDRRHISDDDILALMENIDLPLNLEMAPTDEMLKIALKHRPHAVCLVPERRQELTTEGGLSVAANSNYLRHYVDELTAAGIRVSIFIAPDKKEIEAAANIQAPVVEIHVGTYCDLEGAARAQELERIRKAVEFGASLGLEMHAGHGLAYDTVGDIAKIPELRELNIGHFLIGEAIFTGLEGAIREMRRLMDLARSELVE